MGRKGGRRRVKRRTHVPVNGEKVSGGSAAKAVLKTGPGNEVADQANVPRSIVVKHGKTTKQVTWLVEDLRKVMSPYTALKLKERRNASLKDYTSVATPLNVSHIMVLSQGSKAPNLRIARMPHGPTLTFRIERYALNRQIRTVQKQSFDSKAAMMQPPLVVLNNFDEEDMKDKRHLKIASLTFQSMFPAINVRTVKLNECRRVLLLHLNEEDECIEVRHFLIRTKPHGVSRPIKRVLKSKLPNLGSAEDISEILEANYATSDSEFEDDARVPVDPTKVGASSGLAKRARRPNKPLPAVPSSAQSRVQLSEIGPRLSLRVVKVEDGVFTGEVQYHAFETRSKEEILLARAQHEEKERLKAERRKQQEANVSRKRELEQEKAERKKAKRQRRLERSEAPTEGSSAEAKGDADESSSDEQDSDDGDESDAN